MKIRKYIRVLFFILTGILFNAHVSAQKNIDLFREIGDKKPKAELGDRLLVSLKDSLISEKTNVYLNNYCLGKLKPLENEPGWYSFALKPANDQDTLERIFNSDNKMSKKLTIKIGSDLNHIYYQRKDYLVIFDANQYKRRWFTGISFVIIMVLILRIITKDHFSILRDQSLLKARGQFSLSRTQLAFWTILIILSFFCVWWYTGEFIVLTPQVLVLMGISSGTALTANLIDQNDINNELVTTRHQDRQSSGSFLTDILSDKNGLSIHRLQVVLFSLVIAGYFIYKVFSTYTIPTLDSSLMILFGISSGTYVAIKQSENKTKSADENKSSNKGQKQDSQNNI